MTLIKNDQRTFVSLLMVGHWLKVIPLQILPHAIVSSFFSHLQSYWMKKT